MDAECIIAAIQSRPALWDVTNKFYKNKAIVKQLWEEIARDLNGDIDVLKAKWKNLRDYYRNELKKLQKREETQCEGSRTYASAWPYMESMSFVRHLVNTRAHRQESKINFIKCEPNYDADEVEFENECADEEDSTTMEDGETANTATQQRTTQSYIPTNPPPLVVSASSRLYSLLESGGKRSSTPAEMCSDEMVVVKKKRLSLLEKTYKESEDSDLMFLKSMLPDIKSLPRTRRIQLRLKFQELVCKAVEETEAAGFSETTYPNRDR